MIEKMRYVTQRPNGDGTFRYYWQRKGHPLTRLPANDVERYAKVKALNEAADRGEPPGADRGSIRWVIEKYKTSDRYTDLAHSTKKFYARYLRDIEALGPDLAFNSFTRQAVVDFVETYPKRHQRWQCAAILKNLFQTARYYGVVNRSEADDLRLKRDAPRERLWSDAEINAWLKKAEGYPAHMTTAFMLLCFTAQRPSDVLAMTWAQYDGDTIRLRQRKTKKLLDVACHPALKIYLDGLTRTGLMIVAKGSLKVGYNRFSVWFRTIATKAGTDAQARDLRRTAMVNMSLGGATPQQIASVSGHSIDETQKILDTYIPRSVELGRQAIARLTDARKSNKSLTR